MGSSTKKTSPVAPLPYSAVPVSAPKLGPLLTARLLQSPSARSRLLLMQASDAKPPERDSKQRTLFDLQKVVRLDSSAVCFTAGNVLELKKTLLDPSSPKYLLLMTLRKLDCFRFEFHDLVSTEIGSAVATLAHHPKLEVSKLAAGLVTKWRALIESCLFKQLPYDAQLAATVPEDPPAPPPPPPEQAAQQAADRQTQQVLRRQQELDFLLTDSEEEEPPSQEDKDDDWRPGKGMRAASKRKQKQKG